MKTPGDEIRKRVLERLAEQRALVATLLRQREQLRGSLFVRWAECRKPGCACRQGEKHGPYYVLSLRGDGQAGFAYLEPRQLQRARALVARYKEFRRGFRRLKKLNAELVQLLRRYQEGASRQGGRRLAELQQKIQV